MRQHKDAQSGSCQQYGHFNTRQYDMLAMRQIGNAAIRQFLMAPVASP